LVQLRLIFLGTSSSVPTIERSLSSIAILRGDELLLFDAGEGTQRQMLKAGIGFNRRTKIFITHFHGDHVIGLLGILQTMAMLNRDRPLDIYGPRGIAGFINYNSNYLKFELTYQVRIHGVKEGVIVKEKDYVVRACPAEHSVRNYAYLLDESDRPGVFYPERALELGVPKGVLWSKLQDGESIDLGGKMITPHQVLGPRKPGRKIGISGDTRPNPRLSKFFSKADVIIFDSTYGQECEDKAKDRLHSTALEAAQVARDAGANLLILTHFSARYSDTSELVSQALKVHPNVMAASDLSVVDVPYRDS